VVGQLESDFARVGRLQPRNINVSINNNFNVAIDVITFTFYSDQLIIDAELILGADSLPIHLAYLLKKPHYILYPNGYPQLFMTPYAQINNRFGTFDHYNFSFL
jgi:hypothetical protein